MKEIVDYCLRYVLGFGTSYGIFYLLNAPIGQTIVGSIILAFIVPAWKWNGKRLQKNWI